MTITSHESRDMTIWRPDQPYGPYLAHQRPPISVDSEDLVSLDATPALFRYACNLTPPFIQTDHHCLQVKLILGKLRIMGS